MSQTTTLTNKIIKLEAFLTELEKGVRSLKETQLHTRLLVDKFQDGRLIDFNTLSAVTVNTKLTLSEGVIAHRVPIDRDERIAFVTTFEPGATLPNHHHDCIEVIHILRGDLSDIAKNSMLGKSTTYEPMMPHELHSFRGALLMVYFEK